MNRRELLTTTASAIAASMLTDRLGAAEPATRPATTRGATTIPADVVWHDVRSWGVEGRAFDDTENYFDRLPARAKDVVRPEVWKLARDTAGMSVRFQTDAAAIYARYSVVRSELAMPHLPASGMSGLDIYGQQDKTWHWLGGIRPAERDVAGAFAYNIAPPRRLYVVNLPLYNGVKTLEIGVPPAAEFTPVPPRKDKPVLFYGTSITQGGCASRPGMAFTHILGRRLDRPMLNFGFSGNGRMEVEVARFLAELDPAIFVLDCLANMSNVPIVERTTAVVTLLREKREGTPILILEEREWADAPLLPQKLKTHRQRCADLRAAYDQLIAAGVKNLHYRKGDDVIGSDGEATVDGSHPTDLGMMRYADALEPDLRKLL